MSHTHSPADAELVAQAVALGCLPPNFTRERHPGLFEIWSGKALAVICSQYRRGFVAAIVEADLYCGQPLPMQALAA